MLTYLSEDNRCHLRSGKARGFFYSVICVDAPYRMGYMAIPEGHPWYDITEGDYRSFPKEFPFIIQSVQPYTHYDDPSDASTTITKGKWWGFSANNSRDLHDLSLVEHACDTIEQQHGPLEAKTEREYYLKVIAQQAERMSHWQPTPLCSVKPTVKTTEDMVRILERACGEAWDAWIRLG